MTREEILAVYHEGPEAVFALVEILIAQIAVLEARIKKLESKLNQNSKNSNKPPSSDGFQKTKSQRKKSGKKSGAQKGHPGRTLEMTANPDKVEVHRVTQCQHCSAPLLGRAESFERRQGVDTPPLKLEVTEHQAERKTCHICGTCNKASFPEGVNRPVQYGPLVKALAVYLNQYQLLPYYRVEEFFKDLFGQPFSEGSLFTANQACYEALAGTEQEIKQQLLDSPVIHCDETGSRVEGKTHWLHSVSTPALTCYSIHPKRGLDAMDAMGILPVYTGIAKHDGLKVYFTYTNCEHSLCNDHHLRELTIETEQQTWAQKMHALLLDIKAAVDEAKENAKTCLELEKLMDFGQRYSSIIDLGYQENPFFAVWPKPKGKRGKPKKTKPKNSIPVLGAIRDAILGNPFVPNRIEV